MFNKIREKISDYNKMGRLQAEVKKELEKIFASKEKNGVFVVVRGDKKIEKIEIDGEENKMLKDLINDAIKEAEKKAEKQMRGKLGEMGFPGA